MVNALVTITDDMLYENDEIFTAVISLAVADSAVRIIQPTATVEILDDDSKSM